MGYELEVEGGGASNRLPQTYSPGEKSIKEGGGGGGKIEIHNIHLCSIIKCRHTIIILKSFFFFLLQIFFYTLKKKICQ